MENSINYTEGSAGIGIEVIAGQRFIPAHLHCAGDFHIGSTRDRNLCSISRG